MPGKGVTVVVIVHQGGVAEEHHVLVGGADLLSRAEGRSGAGRTAAGGDPVDPVVVGDEEGVESGAAMPAPGRLGVEPAHQRPVDIVGDVGMGVEVDHHPIGRHPREGDHRPVPHQAHQPEEQEARGHRRDDGDLRQEPTDARTLRGRRRICRAHPPEHHTCRAPDEERDQLMHAEHRYAVPGVEDRGQQDVEEREVQVERSRECRAGRVGSGPGRLSRGRGASRM